MSCHPCGCATQPCGCCEGVQVLTPQPIYNRPGLPALSWRVGTHASFLQTMKARLSTMEVDGLGADGQPLSHLRPLQCLTTRDPSDPSIALLDAWATVGDVLGFYQERHANEAYLRTATERRSVLELSRLVGYTLRPGVAASAYLAYTVDANQVAPVTIAAGARSQSVPDPDETAQTFETSEDLLARREWNNLQVRLHRPQNITLGNALALTTLHVAGVNTNLKPGDPLLLVFSDDGSAAVLRRVASVETQFADQRSQVTMQPLPALAACAPILADWLETVLPLVDMTQHSGDQRAVAQGLGILRQSRLGVLSAPQNWGHDMRSAADVVLPPVIEAAIVGLEKNIDEALQAIGITSAGITTPANFAAQLLQPAVPQVRNSLRLSRSLGQAFMVAGATASASSVKAFTPAAPVYTDVGTQLLVSFAPTIARSYYQAWAGATLNPAQSPLKAVYALRAKASLFGATASKLPSYSDGSKDSTQPEGVLLPPNLWSDWNYDTPDETETNAFLDQANENVIAGGYVLYEAPRQSGEPFNIDRTRGVLRVASATTLPRTAYGLSGSTTQVEFEPLPGDAHWRSVSSTTSIDALRRSKLYVQSEALALVEEPITTPVDTPEIALDGLYDGLVSGRWVVLSGERADIDHVDGVRYAELQMISGLQHSYDPTLPGDKVHTTLTLATALAYAYKRETLTIYGNVVKATHGETRHEVLGSGNGAQALQSFTLKQPPLTFVAAPTAAGAQSTLSVRVNGIEWHEADSLAGLGAKDRRFVTLTDDAGVTSLAFGNGVQGARLPTGVQNVNAVYRNGMGRPGNVKAGQIKLLQTKPLGVKEVVNPLRASGGADKETRDLARENAPLSVMALDRLVSVQDYADFTRRFAGIAKASAMTVSDGRRQLAYLTIAGVDDAPIDATSDLYQNLLAALRTAGDPDLPLRVDLRELKALVLSANLKLQPDYAWEPVVASVRAQLLDSFGFARRRLGQPALLCEVIAAIQQVRGVAYVDVDAFGAVPQTVADEPRTVPPTRHFLTQDDIAKAVRDIVLPPSQCEGASAPIDRLPPDVPAWPGGSDQGLLRPAELVIFAPGVADTLVLNQIP